MQMNSARSVRGDQRPPGPRNETNARVLIVDGNASFAQSLRRLLTGHGYAAAAVHTLQEAIDQIAAFRPHVVLLEMNQPDADGLTMMDELRQTAEPAIPRFVLTTGELKLRPTVDAMKCGAADVLQKPFPIDTLFDVIEEESRLSVVDRYISVRGPALTAAVRPRHMIGRSDSLLRVFQQIADVARHDIPVLLTGESGTGKELVAREIHDHSAREDGPFIPINCGALPDGILASELFGHEEGAFTDARALRRGAFEQADSGTLFLDEVGELSPPGQVSLLRPLQESVLQRVGGGETVAVDVRIVAATNRDLEKAVEEGGFREDLFYRLNAFSIHVVPLRERPDDIPVLSEFFVEQCAKELDQPMRPLAADTMAVMLAYDWPGNVRELENAVRCATVCAKTTEIPPDALPTRIRDRVRWPWAESSEPADGPVDRDERPRATMPELVHRMKSAAEKQMIERALMETGGNQSEAAKLLGVSRRTVYNKITAFGSGLSH